MKIRQNTRESRLSISRYRALAIATASMFVVGCAISSQQSPENPSFEQHLVTQEKDNLIVSVAVLTDDEAEQYFGSPLGKEDIQAVWLKVQNKNTYPVGLLSRSMDPEYFSAFEVSYPNHRAFSDDTNRNGQQAALAVDAIALMDALGMTSAIIGGFDWGARTANVVAALWPERCKAMVSVSGYLIGSQEANRTPLPPAAELQWWYQYYFATERGRAGYDANRREFAKLIWRTASPHWNFDEATFERSATAFDNPDHVAIAIDNYRWRLGLTPGEAPFDHIEAQLAAFPSITVPTITLEGDANGAPHPEPHTYAQKFSGKYAHRLITGGIGHNLPKEAPDAFVAAVVDIDAFASREPLLDTSRKAAP